LFLTLVQHAELNRGAGRHRADPASKVARVVHRRAVDRDNDVTALDAGLGRRAVGLRLGDERAGRLLQAHALGDLRGHRLNLHADPPAGDAALVAQLRDDVLHSVGRNVESDADRAARRREDRRVDTDHVAVDVEGRATGVAFVDRGVDLNEVVIRTGADIAAT